MSFTTDLKVLYHLLLKPVRGEDHAARLESFYGGQAEAYDEFRKRLLKGREELYQSVAADDGGVWVDMGGATAGNLEFMGERREQLGKIYVVDLSPSLLKMAERRIADREWTNVEAVEADATKFRPAEGAADVVTFSYSLTMIPDWFAAINNAWAMLKPGGHIAVVDFFVSRKYGSEDLPKHGWVTRTFWPAWFGLDNVYLSPDHVPYLHDRFEVETFAPQRSKVPYMPFMRVPYYRFIGRKAET